ncbi:uncharacterized protein ATNIH1004_009986 [Aspergillus tanneri]|uniref:Sld7 C-terminal domain-containing protein n=1 Tax=Aspergillus tanneri TaxID=1220188 RepID=A0A5M9MD57_9EURO|nr:uncharacterized protein ATNIH1004_009986 [Aspergillus tanneri]KAA8643224.1 hypothetical protein ATNIH1004_009986 [Aspergillus tanneri]
MNVWSGSLALDSDSSLQGLQLIDQTSSWQSDIHRNSTLSFRGFVNPALVPLYARVGPNLELHTSDIEASQWLTGKLLANIWLNGEDMDRFQTILCPVGLLVGVSSIARTKASASTTTDLLIHGSLSSSTSFGRPPTPPVSSSSSSLDEIVSPMVKQELRIYATPLSTFLISKAQALPSPNHVEGTVGDGQSAEFLPDIRSPSPKRKRVATLFETAAQHHRRVRQKGGEAVSQLMAHSISQPSQQHLQTLRIKQESEELGHLALDRIASQRSRSLSVGANLHPSKPLEPRTEHPPQSGNRGHVREWVPRKNTLNPFMESIAKKEREPSPSLLSSEGRHESSSTTTDADAVILDNKNTITRTILTCMRLYGYNRATARSGSSGKGTAETNAQNMLPAHTEDRGPHMTPSGIPETMPASSTDEDEFKAMYHATYRASTFALRKYLKETPADGDSSKTLPPRLEKEKAMNYIDEFLRLFCEEN